MDLQLLTLIDLQADDTRIAALDAEAVRLPRQIETIQTALAEARKTVETLKARADATRKELRTKEKDLEVTAAKRTKAEGRLYEVKTNKEYSAVLLEIEEIKQQKGREEEEILGLMELQERLATDIREAEGRLKTREEQGRQDEAAVRKKLAAVEEELALVRAERDSRARELPRPLLTDYEKILKARGGLAVAAVTGTPSICGGCRMTIRPQALQELRSGTGLMVCESCGRFLYWQEERPRIHPRSRLLPSTRTARARGTPGRVAGRRSSTTAAPSGSSRGPSPPPPTSAWSSGPPSRAWPPSPDAAPSTSTPTAPTS